MFVFLASPPLACLRFGSSVATFAFGGCGLGGIVGVFCLNEQICSAIAGFGYYWADLFISDRNVFDLSKFVDCLQVLQISSQICVNF